MPVVSPYRVTPDDLGDLDRKTRDGLSPLLDALNVTVQQLVQVSQGVVEQYVDLTLVTQGTVADSFPLVFKHALPTVRAVLLANIRPKDPDHVLTTPFVLQGWTLTDGGLVSIPSITGLLASNSYSLTFLVKS